MKKKIGIMFIMLFVLLFTGCNEKEINVPTEKEEYNKKKVDYLDKALTSNNFDFSNHYLRCNYEVSMVSGRESISYFAYYFDKQGNTRKICYDSVKINSNGIHTRDNCEIEIKDNMSNFYEVDKSHINNNNGHECELYYYEKNEELETKYDYDINEYPNIKKVSDEYISLLKQSNIDYLYVTIY